MIKNRLLLALIGMLVVLAIGRLFLMPGASPQLDKLNEVTASREDRISGALSSQPLDAPSHHRDIERSVEQITNSSLESMAREGAALDDATSADDVLRNASDDALVKAVEEGDRLFLRVLADHPDCPSCDRFYNAAREALRSRQFSGDKLELLASALAQSERVEMVQGLIDEYRSLIGSSPDNESEAERLEIGLEQARGSEEISRVLESLAVRDEREGLREAALTALTGQTDLVAAQALLRYARETRDTDGASGSYSRGVGLGEFEPSDEAIPFISQIVSDGSPESPYAARALLNRGFDGIRQLAQILTAIPSLEEQARILAGAQDHVVFDEQTTAYYSDLKERGFPGIAPALRALLEEAYAAGPLTNRK